MLYNPQEEENVYTIQDLGVDPCLASCGTWLLMSDPRLNLYLVNVLNLERINLLAIESQRDQLFSKPLGFYKYCAGRHFASKAEMIGYPATDKAVVWIDEKTKDYVVACSWGAHRHTAFCKKGDCEWRQIPPLLGCSDIVLKGHKLYIYYEDGRIGISDLKFLTKTAQTNIVITISGDILMVASVLKRSDLSWHFRVYKFNSANNDWEQTVSLGDQAVILDLGITVQASSDIQGITRNSIYFSGLQSSQKDVFVFNLSSQKIQRFSASSISSRPFFNARWLFPTS
ncbi:unnamed protein product [Arabidopsis lyrata]|nr:unnamed protein product [Arabidopsis lyrata]